MKSKTKPAVPKSKPKAASRRRTPLRRGGLLLELDEPVVVRLFAKCRARSLPFPEGIMTLLEEACDAKKGGGSDVC